MAALGELEPKKYEKQIKNKLRADWIHYSLHPPRWSTLLCKTGLHGKGRKNNDLTKQRIM